MPPVEIGIVGSSFEAFLKEVGAFDAATEQADARLHAHLAAQTAETLPRSADDVD